MTERLTTAEKLIPRKTAEGLQRLADGIRRNEVHPQVRRLTGEYKLLPIAEGNPPLFLLPGCSKPSWHEKLAQHPLSPPATTNQLTPDSPYLRAGQFGIPTTNIVTITDGHFLQTAGPHVTIILAFGEGPISCYIQRKGERAITPVEKLGGRADSVWLKQQTEALINRSRNFPEADSVHPMIGFWEERDGGFFALKANFAIGPGISLAKVMSKLAG